MFPEPKIENVYQAWKPIDYGHPLVDPTIHYAPPELERVHIGAGPVPDRPPKINKPNLVFEASREVRGHRSDVLKAEVYNSPRYDKGAHTYICSNAMFAFLLYVMTFRLSIRLQTSF